jgi:hypothetical protein
MQLGQREVALQTSNAGEIKVKNALTVLLLTAAALAAQASANTGATTSGTARKTTAAKPTVSKAIKATTAAKPATIAAAPLTIPKDAVANADGSYSWTDKQGKKWTFIKTPFGISKYEPSGAPVAAPSESLARAKAFDEGDKVRFEVPTPFGVSKWEKNKSELNDEERNLLKRQTSGLNTKQD